MTEQPVEVEPRDDGFIDLVVGVTGPNRLRVRMSPAECTVLILSLTSTLGAVAQTAVDELQKWVNAG